MTRLLILSEDSYGKGFFTDLVNRLKNENRISNFRLYVDRFYGPCNVKLEGQIVAYSELRDCDFFLIIQDSDGKNPQPIRKRIEIHVEANYSQRVKIIIMKCEIEDWICASKDIKVKARKPSEILHHQERYEKNRLRKYVPQLDIDKLNSCSKTFNAFLSFLESLT